MSPFSWSYGLFLGATLVVYWAVSGSRARRNGLLFALSYAFYAGFDWRYLGLIVFSTVLDHRVGAFIGGSKVPWRRRLALGLSVAINIGLLAAFKLRSTLAPMIEGVTGLHGIGGGAATALVPVGMSFYTFQTLSYSLDVYRGQIKPVKSLRDFALFVAFFPQLVAGPIVRASEFLPQLERAPRLDVDQARDGLHRLLCGVVKKGLIADSLQNELLAPYYADVTPHTLAVHWVMALVSFVRLYYDFSGYCDIAIGSARLFGFRLPENFDLPFRALSVREFWQRWHITLYTWLRDYLFQPLAGPRLAEPRTTAALFLTILLIGLWHGTSLPFFVYGTLHGAVVAIEWRFGIWYRMKHRKRLLSTPLRRAVAWFCTVQFVCITGVCIHSNDSIRVVAAWATPGSGSGLRDLSAVGVGLFVAAVLLHALPKGWYAATRARVVALPVPLLGAALGLAIGAASAVSRDAIPFVYFQF